MIIHKITQWLQRLNKQLNEQTNQNLIKATKDIKPTNKYQKPNDNYSLCLWNDRNVASPKGQTAYIGYMFLKQCGV